jgi:hypothetical protein
VSTKIDLADLGVDEVHDHLDEADELRGHAGGDLGGGAPQEQSHRGREQSGHHEGIDVPGPEALAHGVVAEVMDDVFGGCRTRAVFCSHRSCPSLP